MALARVGTMDTVNARGIETMSEQPGNWQGAAERAANGFIRYLLRQMKASSQWYSRAAGMATPQMTPETDEYRAAGNALRKGAKEAGNDDIPIASVHHYQ